MAPQGSLAGGREKRTPFEERPQHHLPVDWVSGALRGLRPVL
jgi:hypothetical protein